MQVMKVQGVSPYRNSINNAKQNFNGHWESQSMYAAYPHEEARAHVELYVPDADESFDTIRHNFLERAKGKGNEDIFRHPVSYNIYTIGGTNYFVDIEKSREYQKHVLTGSAERKLEAKRWVDAVEDKLKIANILKDQGPKMERDKFLTEEGIRAIFSAADGDAKMGIMALVSDYNMDMAKAMAKTIKKLK